MPNDTLLRLAAVFAIAGLAAPAVAETETRSTLMVKVQRQFSTHDLDRNGSISRAEFQSLMSRLAASRGQTDARKLASATDGWFKKADSDRNNRITQPEAQVMLVSQFHKYDLNHDGRLTDADQLRAADLIVQGR